MPTINSFRIIASLPEAQRPYPVGSAPTFSFAPGVVFEKGKRVSATSPEEKVSAIAARAAADRDLELVHAEVKRSGRNLTVRVFIDKPSGVTHEDCAEMSLHIGTILDVEDFIGSAYTLEVSSPGLERGLYKREDYERFAGRAARVKTREPFGSNQRNFRGRIMSVEGDSVALEDKTSGIVHLPLRAIVKANLEIDLEAEFRYAEERSKQAAQSEGKAVE